jgi:RHS repeat-associated protein
MEKGRLISLVLIGCGFLLALTGCGGGSWNITPPAQTSSPATISSTDVFTAPSAVSSRNKVSVSATSVADPTKSSFATPAVVSPSPVVVSYGYDQTGERVLYSNGSSTTYYPTQSYNITGTVPTKHIFANGQVIATIQGTGFSASTYIVNTDHLTGSNVVSDTQGQIQEVLDYYPFGDPRLDEHSTFNEQRKFAGREFDQDAGLSYMGARYHDPRVGRFLSEDEEHLTVGETTAKVATEDTAPITDAGLYNLLGFDNDEKKTAKSLADMANPQRLNPYSYAVNNPERYIDPSGMSAVEGENQTGKAAFDPGGLSGIVTSAAAAYGRHLSNILLIPDRGGWRVINNIPGKMALDMIGTASSVLDFAVSAKADLQNRNLRPALVIGRTSLNALLIVLPEADLVYRAAKLIAPKRTDEFTNAMFTTVGDKAGDLLLGGVKFFHLERQFQDWSSKPNIFDRF